MKKSIFTLLIANIALIGFGQNQKTHKVEAKETFYSIARLYDIPAKELMKVNPKFAPEYKLNPDDILIIHTDQSKVEEQLNQTVVDMATPAMNLQLPTTHTVEKGQTLYSIARQYNTDAKELMKLNPRYSPAFSLKVKDVIVLTANANQTIAPIQKEQQKEIANVPKNDIERTLDTKKDLAIHKVEKGQTLYAIARLYNVSPKDLMALNPSYGPSFSLNVNDKVAISATVAPNDLRNNETQVNVEEQKKPKERRTKTAPIPKDASSDATRQLFEINVVKIHYTKAGQTLASISNLYKISIGSLMRINNITNSSQKFNEGEKVFLSDNVAELSAVAQQNQETVAAANRSIHDSTLIPASYFKASDKEALTAKNNTTDKSFLKLIEYQVQKKETLLDIGNRYGILITKIMELNKMQTVKLKAGQRIFIDAEWIYPQAATKLGSLNTAEL